MDIRFLASIVKALIKKNDTCNKSHIYDFLGEETKLQPESVRWKLRKIKNSIEPELLGFEEIPENIEFIYKLSELTEDLICTTQDEVEIKNGYANEDIKFSSG